MAKPLKEQREKLGKDINDVAMITRIKASYLKAIEEEDFAKLPVEVYTKGYIREYAKFLGYPSDAAIATYEAYLEEIKGKKEKNLADILSDEKTSDNIPSESIEKASPFKSESLDYLQESQKISIEKGISGVKGFSQRILVAASIAGIALLIYLLLPGGKSAPPVQQKIEPEVQYKIPDITPPVTVQDAKQEKTIHSTPAGQAGISNAPLTQTDKSGDKNKPIQKKMHNLDIIAIDKTWIQVIIDGADKKEMLLNPGEKVNYDANKSIDLLIGNAAGVKLKFNGKEFEGLGEKGQVIKLSLPSTIPQPPHPSNSSNL
jgi:cytoskeletal protein RodZ